MTAMTKPIQNRSVVDQPKVKQPNIRTVSPVHHLHSANLCECYIRSLQSPRRSQPWQLSPRALRLLWPYRAARPTSQCKGCSEIASGIQKSAISSKGELLLWTPILISIRQYLIFLGEFEHVSATGNLESSGRVYELLKLGVKLTQMQAIFLGLWRKWLYHTPKIARCSKNSTKFGLFQLTHDLGYKRYATRNATHVLQIFGNIQNIELPPLGWAQLAVSLLPPQRLLPETSMM